MSKKVHDDYSFERIFMQHSPLAKKELALFSQAVKTERILYVNAKTFEPNRHERFHLPPALKAPRLLHIRKGISKESGVSIESTASSTSLTPRPIVRGS